MEKKTIRKDVFASYRQEPSGSYLMANRGLLNPPYHQTLLSISFHRNEIESFACVRSLFLSPFSLSLSLSLASSFASSSFTTPFSGVYIYILFDRVSVEVGDGLVDSSIG